MNNLSGVWKGLTTCILLSFLIGCASTGSPNGGPRDKKPPELVVEKSAPNFSTNFTPEKIELYFDEWIELKNQQKEVLISPPFFRNPKITSRGKKVTVEFPEEEPLREDATYTINFGKSIVDFTEGNPADGFRFVFATGDKIDSLEFKGQLQDAIDGTPVEDILVLMYDVLEDSVVVDQKPFYYARTDKSGTFSFENLKNDTFKVLVLEDINFNYLLDPELERLAFSDSLFILNDSASYNPVFRLFTPEQSLRIINSSSQIPGKIFTVFNKNSEYLDFSFLYPEDFDPMVERAKDTLTFWFDEFVDSVGVVYGLDTLDFTLKPFDSVFYQKELEFIDHSASSTFLAPFDSLAVSFSAPLALVDTSLIRLIKQPVQLIIPGNINAIGRRGQGALGDSTQILLQDSMPLDSVALDLDTLNLLQDSIVVDTTGQKSVNDSVSVQIKNEPIDSTRSIVGLDSIRQSIDSLGIDSLELGVDTSEVLYAFSDSIALRSLIIDSEWKEGFDYRLELLPGAVTDIYGRQNDTVNVDFKTAKLEDFGNIALNLSRMDSTQQYVILLKLNKDIVKKTIVPDTTVKRIEYNRLSVNTYTVELIKDDDKNGEWTTGDYWQKRQPEELKTFTLEKLRQNWDLEADIFWYEDKSLISTPDSLGIQSDSLRSNRPPQGRKGERPPLRNGKSGKVKGDPRDPKGRNE